MYCGLRARADVRRDSIIVQGPQRVASLLSDLETRSKTLRLQVRTQAITVVQSVGESLEHASVTIFVGGDAAEVLRMSPAEGRRLLGKLGQALPTAPRRTLGMDVVAAEVVERAVIDMLAHRAWYAAAHAAGPKQTRGSSA